MGLQGQAELIMGTRHIKARRPKWLTIFENVTISEAIVLLGVPSKPYRANSIGIVRTSKSDEVITTNIPKNK